MTDIIIVVAGLAFLGLLIALTNLRVVPQSRAWVMERIGVYSRTWNTGLHIKIPFIERKAMAIDLREQMLVLGEGLNINHGQYHNHGAEKNCQVEAAYDKSYKYENDKKEKKDLRETASTRKGNFSPLHNSGVHNKHSQPVITKDNVSMEVDAVVFYMVTDPKLFAYGHANPISAIRHLAATTLRNLIGELELDTVLTSREFINTRMRSILDEASDAWGIKVTRVELMNLIISDKELSEAMEKQMIAERKRREQIILAEGERKSAILIAEGKKQAEILEAEGKKQAKILAAEAQREAMICEAEGEAEAILQVQQATAEGIKMVNASEPSQAVLTIKSLEAFQKAADGQATKIIIPSEIQGLAGLASSASEIFKAE